jgi:ABC-type Na+ transport system ATPase subunit NatA
MSKNLAIKINKLFKSYDDVKAVRGIDLEINKGEFYGLLGPNGAGKSTTINSITSLVKPSDGDIEIFGKNIENHFRFARSQVGIAQQEVSTDWFFPLEQLLYFQAGFYGVSRSHAKERIEYLLEKLGLSKHRTKKMRELSGPISATKKFMAIRRGYLRKSFPGGRPLALPVVTYCFSSSSSRFARRRRIIAAVPEVPMTTTGIQRCSRTENSLARLQG